MTIKHIYNTINKAMKSLDDVDFISLEKRKYNQMQLNKAYNILDDFKDELIRENIKQRRTQKK